MTQTTLHQPIDVDATFISPQHSRTNTPCIPHTFTTPTGTEITITEIGLIHPKYNGLKTTFLFDVTDGATDYRLSFDTESLQWFLEWQGDQHV